MDLGFRDLGFKGLGFGDFWGLEFGICLFIFFFGGGLGQ